MRIGSETLNRLQKWWDSDRRNLELHAYFHEYYRNYTPWRIAREADEYLERISLRGRVLSIGCGYGLVEMTIALEDESLSSVTGADINSVKLSDMNQLAKSMGLANVRTVVADGGRLPFRDESFDSVLILATLSHVVSEAPILREAARLVDRNGRIAIIEDANAVNFRRYLWCLRLRRNGRWVERPINPFRLFRMLKRNGFSDISILPYSFKGNLPSGRRRLLRFLESAGLLGLPFTIGFIVTAEGRRP